MKIAIIGAGGKMGSLFTKQLKDEHELYIYDKNKESISQLLNYAKSIDTDKLNLVDLVIITVPLKDTSKVINRVARYMRKSSTLLEISSIKYQVYQTLKRVASRYDLNVISLHPLFGPGIQSFNNANILFIPVINEEYEYNLAKSIFQNANMIKINYKDHDRYMAIILGLTHLTNLVMANILIKEDYSSLKELSSTTFKLQTILIESIMNDSPSLSIQLIMLNPYMRKYISLYKKVTEKVYEDIINNNDKHLVKIYKDTKDRLAISADLEQSYRLMYSILREVNKL